jgi:hypothetical protein
MSIACRRFSPTRSESVSVQVGWVAATMFIVVSKNWRPARCDLVAAAPIGAGLLYPGRGAVARYRAAIVECYSKSGNYSHAQAQSGKRGEEHVFHRLSFNLPSGNMSGSDLRGRVSRAALASAGGP